jgi:hypothetical protein
MFSDDIQLVRGHRIDRNTREYRLSKAIYRRAVLHGQITPLTEEQKRAHKWRNTVRRGISSLRHYPKSDGTSRRGDRYNNMKDDQKKHFVDSLNEGCGQYLACDETGISFDVYQKTLSDDPEFKKAVITALHIVDDTLDRECFKLARESTSLADKIAVRKLRLEVESRRQAHRRENRKIALLKRKVDSDDKVTDHVIGTKTELNFGNLTTPEYNRYVIIINKIKSGQKVNTEESVIYTDLQSKLLAPAMDDNTQMLNRLSSFSQILDNGEDS